MLSLHTILHPTDFSVESVAAFQLASALARDYGAKLVLVTVYPPIRSEVEAIDCAQRDRIDEDLLGNLTELAVDVGADVEFRVEEGEPADMILAVAEETHADLIVMGTHGRSGMRRLLMGSVAEAVNRKAQCPVVTIRRPEKLPHEQPAASVPATTS